MYSRELYHLLQRGGDEEVGEFIRRHRVLIGGPVLWRERNVWHQIVKTAHIKEMSKVGFYLKPSFHNQTSDKLAPLHLFASRWLRIADPDFKTHFRLATATNAASVPNERLLLHELGYVKSNSSVSRYGSILRDTLQYVTAPGSADIADGDGNTALHYCVRDNMLNQQLYSVLVTDFGASQDIPNKFGVTPRQLIDASETDLKVLMFRKYGTTISLDQYQKTYEKLLKAPNKKQLVESLRQSNQFISKGEAVIPITMPTKRPQTVSHRQSHAHALLPAHALQRAVSSSRRRSATFAKDIDELSPGSAQNAK